MSADLLQQAIAAHNAGDRAAAERLYREVIMTAPDHAHAHRMLAILLLQRDALEEAEPLFARAAMLAPDEPYMHQNHAMALNMLGRFEAALDAAARAIQLKADYALAYYNRASALAALSRHDEAIADYRRATALGITDAAVYFELGFSLAAAGRRDDALAEYERAIAARPDFIEAIANRGVLLKDMGRLAEALAAFDRAVMLGPQIAESHNQRGTVLHELHRPDEALAAFRAALSLKPDYAKALFNIGNVLFAADRWDDALKAYNEATRLSPDLAYLEEARLRTALHLCDWTDFAARTQSLLSHVEQGAAAQPFSILCLPSTAAQQKICATHFAREKCPPQRSLFRKVRKPGRLRIAYVSTIFRQHAVSQLISEMLEQHDRDSFEIFGISHGINDNSPARARMAGACEHFLDVAGWDDIRIARQISDLAIDIAIDLDGYTEGGRPAILAHRPAPLQMNFLGYPGTMGASHIDYIIGDATVTPPEHEAHFSEKIIRLPHAYQPNSTRPLNAPPARAECGLPDNAFVFGCFNNHYKITPPSFDVWMRILSRVPDSVLWLLATGETAQNNLRREAAARAVDPARLIFARRAPWEQHLARQQNMDLFLDTFFYGAHTTASDALWNGVPLVTMLGDTFASRVAASLVTAAGVPELIAATPSAYETLAGTLAQERARLAALKQRLAAARATGPLFDAALFARHLEQGFKAVWARHEQGLPPGMVNLSP
jgi:predicted O-linked N-acetylglucosamine transferase (SPINDLY family)